MDNIRNTLSCHLGGCLRQYCTEMRNYHLPPKPVIPKPTPVPNPEISPTAYKANQRKVRTAHRERLERIRKEGFRGSLDQLRSQGR